MDTLQRIEKIENFWTREFAYYLNEHRHPANRATHMVGIPTLITTAIAGLVMLPSDLSLGLWLLIGGQVVGWTFQLIGHRIEGNRPALLKRPISFLMGPLMVLAEMVELLGVQLGFAKHARQVVFGTAGELQARA